ncbi:MAG TPA: bifunctional DNA-formamidopyrimidine glycosylase/DNA-(apurinic or apyrimidinic site) lyase [Burkholderiales bacterium]|nr:bifunctional DNA-formamidopyrimidine glycosylase/DNA-(apurinic or apyrimidinic site) lyase [Burkholderiales bacterium]
MPELPEVETTRRGIEPWLLNERISGVAVRHAGLRWPVPGDLARHLRDRSIRSVQRRSKYLLLDCESGWLILHLGMSGSLRVVLSDTPCGKHDHFDLVLGNGRSLRLTDPRRFGAVLWHRGDPAAHKLLRDLGPEPFDVAFDASWLHAQLRGRTAPIKNLLMDAHIVCGVGNIYANESLFRAGIHPNRAGGRISLSRCARLVEAVQTTLRAAIDAGGSTLRDFVHADGGRGYFQQSYFVYGRAGEPCRVCGTPIRSIRLGQRSTFLCPRCQR